MSLVLDYLEVDPDARLSCVAGCVSFFLVQGSQLEHQESPCPACAPPAEAPILPMPGRHPGSLINMMHLYLILKFKAA